MRNGDKKLGMGKKKKSGGLRECNWMYVYNTGSEVERRSPLLLLFPPLSSSEFLTFHQAGEPRETQFAHS